METSDSVIKARHPSASDEMIKSLCDIALKHKDSTPEDIAESSMHMESQRMDDIASSVDYDAVPNKDADSGMTKLFRVSLSKDSQNIPYEAVNNEIPSDEAIHNLLRNVPDNYGKASKNIPASQKHIKDEMSDSDVKVKVSRLMGNERSRMSYDTLKNHLKNKVDKYDRETAKSIREPLQGNSLYQKNTITTPRGNLTYNLIVEEPPSALQFENEINRHPDEKIYNYECLKHLVTREILNHMIQSHIHSIYVIDGELIINNIRRIPNVGNLNIDFRRSFPDGVYSAIDEGNMAFLFDWSCIKGMGNLSELIFSDMNYVSTYVVSDLGIRHNWGLDIFFDRIRSLQSLTVGSETVKREEIKTEKSVKLKEDIARHKRFNGILDGYSMNIYKTTDFMQDFFCNSVKNYMTNRGNKGFPRYFLGVTARGVGALGASAVNLGTHMAGGIFNAIRTAFTDVGTLDENDISYNRGVRQ